MNVSRNFVLVGILFLIVGVFMGMYMGGSGDFSLAPVHAHINLLGFTLMMIFGLVYRAVPVMADNMLARLHFWLHTAGSVVMVVMLFLLMSGSVSDAAMTPILPIAELAVFIGVLVFGWNLYRNYD